MSVGLLKDLNDGKLTKGIFSSFFCSELRKTLKLGKYVKIDSRI